LTDRKSKKRRTRKILKPFIKFGRYLPLFILLGLGLHFFLPYIVSLEKSTEVIRSFSFGFVALAVASQVTSYLGSGYLLRAIVALGKQKLSVGRGALITMGAASIGLAAGGMLSAGAATYRWLNQHGSEREWSTIAGILPATLNTIVLAGIAVFGMIQLFITNSLTRLQLVGFAISLLPITVLVLLILLGSRFREKVSDGIERIAAAWMRLWKRPFDPTPVRQGVADFFFAWDLLRDGKWKRPMLGAVITAGFDMGTLFFIFLAAGHPVSPAILLTGYGLPMLLGRAAFMLPGGVGVVESSMAALYSSLGVPEATSVVAVLGYRLISFWSPSLLGFPVVLLLQSQLKTQKNGDAE
jgi:uncharacterized protein (TIRG00374 family)